ncbi:MAG: type I 3-dehydroquinate dehydratase [Clostridia bacterium]
MEHQKRGADICKIVTGADTMEQQLENLKIINMLKENLKIPFLFLCGGECRILRRIGGELGCCMYLCVHEYDALATPAQPLLKQLKTIRDNIS